MKNKVKQLTNYMQLNTAKNPVDLLNKVGNIICGHKVHCLSIYTMVELIKMLCYYYQYANVTNKFYNKQF